MAKKLTATEKSIAEFDERLEAIEKCRQAIEKEIDYVDIKPYSHNIIGLSLGALAQKTDNEAANMLIEEFDLESLGWSKIT